MRLELIDLPTLVRIDSETGRLYKTPEGNLYPSVTTVLSSIPNPDLESWKLAVGQKEAKRIGQNAANRGTVLHQACENYILGKKAQFGLFDLEAAELFRIALKVLTQLDVVYSLEGQLYSDRLKLAGSVDVVASINDIIYIIDWKTSSRYKSASEISSYFMQCAAYAAMFYERTGIRVKFMKVCILSSEYGLQEYNEPVHPWLLKFIEVNKDYVR